jgi:prepilin-type N-terminal cleavage/methylation domain-containing protein
MIKLNKLKKKKGFTLVELLVVVAILAILLVALIPSALGYSDKARDTRAAKDIRNFTTVVEAFASADGNYPEASLDTDNPRSIASVMQSKGIKWTGDETGVVDPWNNPYYYDLTEDYYCIASAGKDGTLNTEDDICNISGKASKKASGLDGNAIPSAVPGNNPGGGGPEHQEEIPDGYIEIASADDLAKIGIDEDYPLSGNYILTADINLSDYSAGEGWNPIGDYGSDGISIFTGTFNGNNYVISNLKISRPDTNYQGLFGCTDGGKIENLGLENVDVTGNSRIGGLVGYNNGTITNCYATGSVSGNKDRIGGLVGWNNGGTLTNCYATGEVRGGDYTGGLVGSNDYSSITSCYATGEVTGNYGTGGLVGYNYDSITNSYATGSVSGNSCLGGLVGRNDGALTNCYATGNVSGSYTGGLVGSNTYGTVTNSYYNSETTGQSGTGKGSPLTTAQMKQQGSFIGWDFVETWLIDNSYPYLQPNEQIPHPGI